MSNQADYSSLTTPWQTAWCRRCRLRRTLLMSPSSRQLASDDAVCGRPTLPFAAVRAPLAAETTTRRARRGDLPALTAKLAALECPSRL